MGGAPGGGVTAPMPSAAACAARTLAQVEVPGAGSVGGQAAALHDLRTYFIAVRHKYLPHNALRSQMDPTLVAASSASPRAQDPAAVPRQPAWSRATPRPGTAR